MNHNRIRALSVFVIGVALWFSPVPSGLTQQVWHLFAIFATTIVGFILQPLPIGALGIISLGLTGLLGVLKPTEVLSGFSSTTLWLVVVTYFYAVAFIKTGLGQRIAYMVVGAIGDSTLKLGYALVLSDLIMAPGTPSNTARAGILAPIVRSVATGFASEPGVSARRVGAYLTQTVFHGNCINSSMFLTGSAPNSLVVMLTATALGFNITWGMWAMAALVPGLISILVIPYLIYKIYPPEITRTPEAKQQAHKELATMGPMSYHEKMVAGIFILSLLLWSTGRLTQLDSTMIAISGVGMLLISGVITWQDVLDENGAWDTMVWLGTMLGLADYLNKLGLFKWFAAGTSDLLNGISWEVTLVALLLIYTYTHYAFAGNTTHIVAMYVAFGSMAISAGAPVSVVALSMAFMSNLESVLTHYGNGPAVVYFGTGYVEQGSWWRIGFIVSIAYLIIWCGLGSVWWKVLGLW